jgi:hypothetical protein
LPEASMISVSSEYERLLTTADIFPLEIKISEIIVFSDVTMVPC